MYGHFLKNFLVFLYKFKFSEAYISVNNDLGPIKILSFLDFADQTEQLWQIYLPPKGFVSLAKLATKLISVKSKAITSKSPIISIEIQIFRGLYISLNIDLGSITVVSFLDFADQTEPWQIYPHQGLVILAELSTKLFFVKPMASYLKISYYFYRNLNFQRPICH